MSYLSDAVARLEKSAQHLNDIRALSLIPSTATELSPFGQDLIFVFARHGICPQQVADWLNIPTKTARAFLKKASK